MFYLTDFAVHLRMYQTLQLWVQEPMLHDSKLYLPALPQQYQADRLLQLFQNQKVCCSQSSNSQNVLEEI